MCGWMGSRSIEWYGDGVIFEARFEGGRSIQSPIFAARSRSSSQSRQLVITAPTGAAGAAKKKHQLNANQYLIITRRLVLQPAGRIIRSFARRESKMGSKKRHEAR